MSSKVSNCKGDAVTVQKSQRSSSKAAKKVIAEALTTKSVDSNDTNQVLEVLLDRLKRKGKGKERKGGKKKKNAENKKNPVRWTDVLTNALILCYKNEAKGSKSVTDAVWKNVADRVVDAMDDEGVEIIGDFDAQACKNKFNRLRSDYKIDVKMRRLSGLAADGDEHHVVHFDDFRFSTKNTQRLFKHPFRFHDQMDEVIGKKVATGEMITSATAFRGSNNSTSSNGNVPVAVNAEDNEDDDDISSLEAASTSSGGSSSDYEDNDEDEEDNYPPHPAAKKPRGNPPSPPPQAVVGQQKKSCANKPSTPAAVARAPLVAPAVATTQSMYRAGKISAQERGASIIKESIDNLGTKMAGGMEVIAKSLQAVPALPVATVSHVVANSPPAEGNENQPPVAPPAVMPDTLMARVTEEIMDNWNRYAELMSAPEEGKVLRGILLNKPGTAAEFLLTPTGERMAFLRHLLAVRSGAEALLTIGHQVQATI